MKNRSKNYFVKTKIRPKIQKSKTFPNFTLREWTGHRHMNKGRKRLHTQYYAHVRILNTDKVKTVKY